MPSQPADPPHAPAQPQPHTPPASSLDSRSYFERNNLNRILEAIVAGLSFNQPSDPLAYIEECVAHVRKLTFSDPGAVIPWDLFMTHEGTLAGDRTKRLAERQKVSAPVYGPVQFEKPTKPPKASSLDPYKSLPPIPSASSKDTPTPSAPAPSITSKEPLPAIAAVDPAILSRPAWSHIVFVLGGPGSGKGTVCARLKDEFGYVHLSAGDLLRAEVAKGTDSGKELDILMKEGKIVPAATTLRLMRAAMESAPASAAGFLIDGFPRQMDQALEFEEKIVPCQFALCFECPLSVLEQRLLKRGETSGRADDNAETIAKRFRTFEEASRPVIDYFESKGRVVKISSVPPPGHVYQTTRSHFIAHGAVPIPPLTNPNIILVLGGPGSGKGTQCARLAESFDVAHLSTGDLLRAEVASGSTMGRELQETMSKGGLVPTAVVLRLLKRAMVEREDALGFLVDGFPRALDQAQEFESVIGTVRTCLYFECGLETLEARLVERGKTSGRADDNVETIRLRFKTFQEQSMPVVEYFEKMDKVVKISSEAPVDEVYENARKHFESALTLPFQDANIVFVLGGPGSGKGTQCDKIVDTLGFAHLSTGDLLRAEVAGGSPLGKEIEAVMKEGKMVDLALTKRLLLGAMKAAQESGARGFLVDGFPRTVEQAQVFEKTIGRPKMVLFFEVPEDVLVQRLLKRGETSGRADDNLESIKKRIEMFVQASLPVVQHYEVEGKTSKVGGVCGVVICVGPTVGPNRYQRRGPSRRSPKRR
ncbi:ADK-domain-containing protein [Gonapodya prolifera JEL478]|uniref:ADK-domain-containing protein n=1 Tax=Gonapodya prolifera (strain JEL478) TaxID=1344416 RepID=A0A139AT46_GONPJ|nr:ADK-domain-containing protein [Gonapodya prolifera JEL478]|eukprot:KXS19902.1 ADK-domain-containing protein [Gonapodya prolifera JEL478]